jgi:hypothetical protein
MAQDAAGDPSFRDIMTLAKDKNAKLKIDKIAEAIELSSHTFTVKDVYALVDLDLDPALAEKAAKKAGIFWNGAASLNQIAADGRASASPQTLSLKNSDLVILFEEINEYKNAEAQAIKAVGELAPRASHEDDNKYQLRKRKHDEAMAHARAPWEGKIDATTFQGEFTGSFTVYDGSCTQAHINVDLSMVKFELFRTAMGGLRVEVPIQATSKNIQKAQFSAMGAYRFEAWSTPICVSSGAAASLAGQGSKLKITFKRTHDSDTWTGTGEFYNGKTNAKL